MEPWGLFCKIQQHGDLRLQDTKAWRFKITRFKIPSNRSFDKVILVWNSCHLVEQFVQDFFCDCFEGILVRLCKHSVGLIYKTGTIEVKNRNVPVSSYHHPSPDVSLIEMPVTVSQIRPSKTLPASIILNISLSRNRSREPSPAS